MPSASPIRVAAAVEQVADGDELAGMARRLESEGFDTIVVPDHLDTLNPGVTLMAAAAATSTLRVGTAVYNNDLRHPAITAQEAATIDLLSGGRFELGIGAGWNRPEYDSTGITMDPASTRIARLEESVIVLRRLFSGDEVTFSGDHYRLESHRLSPAPPQGRSLPIHIGGNGDSLLAVAARHADIVGISPYSIGKGGPRPTHFGLEALRERLAHVRDHLDGREMPDINIPVQRVALTDDPARFIEEFAGRLTGRWPDAPGPGELSVSPYVLAGTAPEIAQRLLTLSADLGVSYFTVWSEASAQMAEVVAELARA